MCNPSVNRSRNRSKDEGVTTMGTNFAQALEAKTLISEAMSRGAAGLAVIKEEAHRKAIQAGHVVGVGVGYLDPVDEGKGAAVVLYTTKALSRQEADALAGGVKVDLKAGQVTIP